MSDSPVQSTDCDALLSRISCSELGYTTNDDYSSLFLPSRRRSLTPTPPPRRPPLINLGTHLRTIALDSLVNQFLSLGLPPQIISLGAGTDSRFWRLQGQSQQCHHYVEVDFQESTSNKARSITTHHQLKEKLGGNFTLGQSWSSRRYYITTNHPPIHTQTKGALDYYPRGIPSYRAIYVKLINSVRPSLIFPHWTPHSLLSS